MTRPLPIILDQKDWIYLARGQSGADSRLENAAKYLSRIANNGMAIIPLSITHFDETLKRLDDRSRIGLAKFMYELSKGNVILPATAVIELELDNVCRRFCSKNELDVGCMVFGQGVPDMIGKRVDIQMPSGYPMDPKIRSHFLQKVRSPEMILDLMKIGWDQDMIRKLDEVNLSCVSEIEAIRAETSSMNAETRHSIELVKYFRGSIYPPLISCLLRNHVSPTVLQFDSKKEMMAFFKSVPTAYCLFELDFYRNLQQQRKIQPNDLNDILSLAVAVPYAKVIVTEPIWQNGIKSRKLDSINENVVLTSRDLPDLPNIIERMF
jgi:hypothetical protein